MCPGASREPKRCVDRAAPTVPSEVAPRGSGASGWTVAAAAPQPPPALETARSETAECITPNLDVLLSSSPLLLRKIKKQITTTKKKIEGKKKNNPHFILFKYSPLLFLANFSFLDEEDWEAGPLEGDAE